MTIPVCIVRLKILANLLAWQIFSATQSKRDTKHGEKAAKLRKNDLWSRKIVTNVRPIIIIYKAIFFNAN